MPREQHVRKVAPSKASVMLAGINRDIKALNASIMIISQKMRYLVRNEKILGRNLLVLNKKLKSLEGGAGGVGSNEINNLRNELANLSKSVEKNSTLLMQLQSSIDEIRETYAKNEDVKEMKYVVDSINPLEFVTFADLEEIVGKKALKAKAKRGK